MKTMTDFIFLGSKITVDGDCSHEIKRSLSGGAVEEKLYAEAGVSTWREEKAYLEFSQVRVAGILSRLTDMS